MNKFKSISRLINDIYWFEFRHKSWAFKLILKVDLFWTDFASFSIFKDYLWMMHLKKINCELKKIADLCNWTVNFQCVNWLRKKSSKKSSKSYELHKHTACYLMLQSLNKTLSNIRPFGIKWKRMREFDA